MPKLIRPLFWVLPLLYFLLPMDLLPDGIPRLGRLDDLIVGLFLFWVLDRGRQFAGFQKEFKTKGWHSAAADSDGGESPVPPHAVLGVPSDAPPAAVKRAYRQLLSKYHPDRFVHMGADFERAAQLKTRVIIDAYQRFTAGRR